MKNFDRENGRNRNRNERDAKEDGKGSKKEVAAVLTRESMGRVEHVFTEWRRHEKPKRGMGGK